MRKKGFTLIELLAVIVILAIIALIATPIVMSTIEKSKKGANERSAENYVNAAQNAIAVSRIDGADLPTGDLYVTESGDLCRVGLVNNACPTGSLIAVELNGTKPKSGKVAVSEGTIKTVNNLKLGDTYVSIEADGTITSSKSLILKVGEEVILKDNTIWIVLDNNLSDNTKIRLISKLNLNPAVTTTSRGNNIFKESDYHIAFGSSNKWISSDAKTLLDTKAKPAIEASLGTTLSEITIAGSSELKIYGCEYQDLPVPEYQAVTCESDNPLYNKIVNNSNSWTKIDISNPAANSCCVFTMNGNYSWYDATATNPIGIRPIITVSKDVIL